MINRFSQLNTNLFIFINHLPHNFILDYFFGVLSFIGEYGAIWFFLTLFISLKYQPQKRWSFVARIFITGLFSLLLIFVLKNFFGRLRPEFSLNNVILPFGSEASFSFPSGHALMSFVFAYLLAKWQRCEPSPPLRCKPKYFFFALAILVSFSRIYLGYHYPLDIVGGAFLGILIGFLSFRLASRFN